MSIKILVLVLAIASSIKGQAFLKNQQELINFDKHIKAHDSKRVSNSELLEIHLIPHSHDDVGWLKSVDEYFYGNRNDIQLAGVQYTIDGIVTELLKDSRKTFVYVEMAFFYRWYKNQDSDRKMEVKGLVDNGQLEFINGGVCMNDEAAPYYEDMIDQMTWGHQFLKREFNVAPTIGWQIDPFGHSATQAKLFYEMGFDGWFFARIDISDKNNRLNNKNLECISNPVSDAEQNKPIFTGVLYRHYESVPGFGFDVGQRDDPIMFDKSLEDYNLEKKADDFINYFRDMQQHYKQNILMHTMGSDFQYMDAKMNFMNMDQLLHYLEKEENVKKYNATVKYSTVSRYLKRVNDLNITSYQTKTDDFFPYASDGSDYWTGYFTSRVNSKFLIKETGRFLQQARSMLSQLENTLSAPQVKESKMLIFELEHYMGIVQHHDAVSGTEREAVNQDYSRILVKARDGVQAFLTTIISDDVHQTLNLNDLDLQFCRWNQTSSDCGVISKDMDKDVLLAIQPSMTYLKTATVLQVKVHGNHYTVNKLVETHGDDEFKYETICSDHYNPNNCILYIHIQLQVKMMYFRISANGPASPVTIHDLTQSTSINHPSFSLSVNDFQKFNYDLKNTQNQFDFSLDYLFYKSYQGDGHKSGAYAFRPDSSKAEAEAYSQFNAGKVYVGSFLTVVELYSTNIDFLFYRWYIGQSEEDTNHILSQVKFYHGASTNGRFSLTNSVEVETFVNSIDVSDEQGKEIIMRVGNENIKNNGVFYTDSNGLELQKRTLNHRDTWEWVKDEYVTGNYYPVNAMIGVHDQGDDNKQMYVLNDRSQGGSVLTDGQIEVMIHRRVLYDDNKGVCEPLNEKDLDGKGMRSRMKHYITNSYNQARKLQVYLDIVPITILSQSFFSSLHIAPSTTFRQLNLFKSNQNDVSFMKFSFMADYDDNNVSYIRLQNMDPDQPLMTFNGFPYPEISLTTNMDKKQMEDRRLKWNYTPTYQDNDQQNINGITLKHLEIKTFKQNRV